MTVAEDTTAELAVLPMAEVPAAGRRCAGVVDRAKTVGALMQAVRVRTQAIAQHNTRHHAVTRRNHTAAMAGRTVTTADRTVATVDMGAGTTSSRNSSPRGPIVQAAAEQTCSAALHLGEQPGVSATAKIGYLNGIAALQTKIKTRHTLRIGITLGPWSRRESKA